MKVERYEKWEPVNGITAPAAWASVKEDHEGLSVTLVFSEVVGEPNKDLRIAFGRVPAYAVYEEFVHPGMAYGFETRPTLAGKWENATFPLLVVKDSMWLGSFADSQLLNWPECVHYRLLTLDQIVDVLCNTLPEVTWIETEIGV